VATGSRDALPGGGTDSRDSPDAATFVLQSSLSDFYVEYTLNFQPEEPAQRVFILSELHTNIQDAFNEHGVQILSPHFMSQPEHSVVVPRERWWSAPADRNR
jgi:small-conductance mechanosensitive channel